MPAQLARALPIAALLITLFLAACFEVDRDFLRPRSWSLQRHAGQWVHSRSLKSSGTSTSLGRRIFDKHPPKKFELRIGTVSQSGDLHVADYTVLLDGEPYKGRISGKFFGVTQIELTDSTIQPSRIYLHMLAVSTHTKEPDSADRLYLDRYPEQRPRTVGLAPELQLPQYIRH
ncbi:MAG: hypothetical protein ACI9EF_001392 [Pseudohongiellaceae bacterium]|jgi:hypothetical protein